jgi:5'-methylthioadenosine phosphorylase
MMTSVLLGIIGGSGLADVPGLQGKTWQPITTPFGAPSDNLCFGELAGQDVVFLPRHGRGHTIPPDAINFRANIDALKQVGVTDLVSFSACGSLQEQHPPGSFVLVDQYVDRTLNRVGSFFEPGLVAHVSMAEPVCNRARGWLKQASASAGIDVHDGGTYLAMNGPQFSTKAESALYRSWGCDVIGMTNMPEAKLAREAEICYAAISMVTDYDCWHPDHDHVEVADILRIMHDNATKAHALMGALAKTVAQEVANERAPCPQGCDRVLDTALVTAPDHRDPDVEERLSAILARVEEG